jgi:predicted TPR repeat methyltransferase
MIANPTRVVMSGNFEQARDFFQQGITHYEAGRFAAAERDFSASLALLPGRVSTLTNLGAAVLKLGRFQQAADLLEEALQQEPGNVEALSHRAAALAELGEHAKALECVDRAVQIEPKRGPAWALRGNLLKDLGRVDEARESFERAIANGADTSVVRYQLAATAGGDAPSTAPREYVETLFDRYADGFEEHLVQVLNYRAPEILVQGLHGRHFTRALDLGCGTGLCGPLLRPLAVQLDGVDLSANMVERSAARGVYDQVVHSDAVEFLANTDHRYDLIMAADVFVYIGDLEALFSGVARVLQPGGVFCFCIEVQEQHDFLLRPSLRYAHSPGYIRKLAVQYGFEFGPTQSHPIRDDQQIPIPGLFAWLAKPAA